MDPTNSSSPSTRRGPPGLRDPREWHRDYPERKIAGVCASVAHNLNVSITVVRVVFVLLALPMFHIGLWLYGILWVLVPPTREEPSPLDRPVRTLRELARPGTSRGDASRPGEPWDEE